MATGLKAPRNLKINFAPSSNNMNYGNFYSQTIVLIVVDTLNKRQWDMM